MKNIFKGLQPKTQSPKVALTREQATDIYNVIKEYDSIGQFIEANSGVFSPTDIKDVWKCAIKLAKEADRFLSGTYIKDEATFDEEGVELTPVEYWTKPIEFVQWYRAENPDELLDILLVGKDYRDGEFN